MAKYLDERRKGKSKLESITTVGMDEKYLNQWLTRSLDICRQFKDDDLKVTVDLILRGFKWDKSIREVCEMADVSEDTIRRSLRLGARGSEIYRELFDYYEDEMIPKKLDIFLNTSSIKSIRNALESAYLSEGELNKYYELGKSGDERFVKFYNGFYDVKKGIYVYHIEKGKSHNIAMRESRLTYEEFEESNEDIEKLLRKIKFNKVLEAIADDKTSNVAARNANCSVDEIYEWYFKGRDGDEEYEQFYLSFHGGYVRPCINAIQESMDNNLSHLDHLIKVNKEHFTKKDVDIWIKYGLLDNAIIVNLKRSEDEDKKEDMSKPKENANEMLREMGVEDYDKITTRKTSKSSSILSQKDYDEEDIKKQILKK